MGDWASEFSGDVALLEDAQEKAEARSNFRCDTWRTKDGRVLLVRDMTDSHLLNAYKYSQSPVLFKEMVFRLFQARVVEQR